MVTSGCSTQVKESNTQEPGGQKFKIAASVLIAEDGPVKRREGIHREPDTVLVDEIRSGIDRFGAHRARHLEQRII